RHSFFVGLQSIYFNVRISVVEMAVKSDGALRKLKGALFMNRVLSEVKHRNVIFLDSGTDLNRFVSLVQDKRLRSRTDDFLLVDEKYTEDLQAFSIGKQTHFVDVDGKLRLSPEDLAVRQAILAPAAAPK